MIHASPIAALIDYYHRLAKDPDEDVAPFGFRTQNISACILLDTTGAFQGVQDLRQETNGNLRPLSMEVPYYKTRTSGEWPNFLWDHSEYVLGLPVEGEEDRAARRHTMFVELHQAILKDVEHSPELEALLAFFESHTYKAVKELTGHEELVGRNIVFKFRGGDHLRYFHQVPELREAWGRRIAECQDSRTAPNLIDGEVVDIADTHPLIQGVRGTNQNKGAIVSFNKDKTAFTSYGKETNYNAPIGIENAFEYATALNTLLSRHSHRARFGDMTVVFWSGRSAGFETLLSSLLGGDAPADDEAEDPGRAQRLRSFVDALRRGVAHEGVDEADAPFYILGLSPNAARISVRFWLSGTVGEFADRLSEHVRNLDMTGGRDEMPLSIRRLLRETAREAKDIPPQLAGEIGRAVLAGSAYPMMLYSAVLRRVRADQTMTHPRAAILKACLIRNYRTEVPVALNKDHPDPAYHLGRLFAGLEKTQEDALPGIKNTIKDGYFSTASATPAAVFPRLIRLHQHHVEKLPTNPTEARRERTRTSRFFNSLIQEICSHVEQFPAHLPLQQQGLFQIGYYHQRQDLFTKRESTEATEETADV